VSSAGCSENGNVGDMVNATGDTDTCTTAFNSLVTELKDELKKQKANYESRIRRYSMFHSTLMVKGVVHF